MAKELCRVSFYHSPLPFAYEGLARSLTDLRGRYQNEDQRRHSFGDVRSLITAP
jgi:hypothetical protein